jgi:hypothetical protein
MTLGVVGIRLYMEKWDAMCCGRLERVYVGCVLQRHTSFYLSRTQSIRRSFASGDYSGGFGALIHYTYPI